MSVLNDAQSTTFTGSQSLASYNDTSFTVGSSTNRALVVVLVCESTTGNSPTAPTLHWDSAGTNQNMTLIQTMSDNRGSSEVRHFWFGLVAPTSGNKTLAVAGLNTNCASILAYFSWTGADQTGGTTTFKNGVTTNNGSSLVTISSTCTGNVGDGAMAVFSSNDSTPTTNQTSWCTASLTSVSFDYHCSNYNIMVGTSVTMSASWSSATSCSTSGLTVNQFTAGAAALATYQSEKLPNQLKSMPGPVGHARMGLVPAPIYPTQPVVTVPTTGGTLPFMGVG